MSGALISAVVLSCAAFAGAAGYTFRYRRHIRRQMDTVLEQLDRAIGGTIQ